MEQLKETLSREASPGGAPPEAAIITEMRTATESIASSEGTTNAQVVSKGGLIHDNVR